MTKARTKAEARRRKAGRKADEFAPRYPNGRKKPASRAKAALEAYERAVMADLHTAGKRCARAGWKDTAENRDRAARDWRFGTLPGVLNAAATANGRPLLSTRALQGLMEYAVAREAWRRAEGLPSEWAGIASYCDVRGGTSKDPFEPSYAAWINRLRARFIPAERVLIWTGLKPCVHRAFAADENVAASDVPTWAVAEIEEAGQALARHFGV